MRAGEAKKIEGNPTWHLTERQLHEVYIGDSALLAEVPLIGRMQLLDALPNALIPHKHDGVYEVTLVLDGCLDFTVEDRHYPTRGGMLFITRPGQWHGSIDSTLQPAEWYWAHLLLPHPGTAMPGLTTAETKSLTDAFAAMTQHVIYGSELLQDCFGQLLAEHRSKRPFAEFAARACFHRLLVQILRDYERSQSLQGHQEPSRPIRLAIQWLNDRLGSSISVTELAEASGLSESHFRQRFHQEMGITPSDFIARQRVRKAKSLLKSSDLSITEIAFQLGFQSSPYFAAVFKKLTGQTPSQFREGPASADTGAD